MNGVEICSLQEGCWYEDAGFGDQDGLEKMDMRNAFWNAYMSSLVKALLLYPFSDGKCQAGGRSFQWRH